eukprot:g31683.t1
MDERLPFSLTGTQWTQKTFTGRLRHFLAATDPRLAFLSDQSLQDAKALLEKCKAGKRPPDKTDAELWQARYAVETTYAKDGEKIPLPFRMSGYALANVPITVGLLFPNLSTPATFFFQWANQTQNALLNHYNRPSVEPLPMDKILPAYGVAVAGALGVSWGSNFALTKASMSEATRNSMKRFVPFVSVAFANALNTYTMRRHETTEGIEVYAYNPATDGPGEYLGKSQKAATNAIAATCASRVFMSACMLIVPPIIMPAILDTSFFKPRPQLHLPFRMTFISGCLFTFVPAAVGLMSQEVIVPSKSLEDKFAALRPEPNVFQKGCILRVQTVYAHLVMLSWLQSLCLANGEVK